MPIHKEEYRCKMCDHVCTKETECTDDCSEHGPFPTKWTIYTIVSDPYKEEITIIYQRYIYRVKIEEKRVIMKLPGEPT